MKSSIADNRSAKSLALLGAALGAAALGAVAVGAVAIGYMAIGRLAIGRLRIGVLEVDELKVRSLTVPTTAGMQPSGPMGGSAKGKGRTSQPTEATPFIRRAASADSDETAAMFSRALRSMSFFPKLHSDEEDRAFVRCFIENDETWIALCEGRVVGVASLAGSILAHLYVDPAHSSVGIGGALLAHVQSQRPHGFELWTFQANTGARRFYERHGCVAVGFTDGTRNEEKLPDVRYAWRG